MEGGKGQETELCEGNTYKNLIMLIFITLTLTLMQGRNGSAEREKICVVISTTKLAQLTSVSYYLDIENMYIWLDHLVIY